MLRRSSLLRQLLLNENGAVAPIIAVSVVGLVGVGALAVDFARISALDTELQDAADHAALAAATQLTGDIATRCSRADAAARQFLTNNTRFANDGQSASADVVAVNFYAADEENSKEPGAAVDCVEEDAEGDPATVKFVEVVIEDRTANYSFVRLISRTADQNWDVANAKAVAGLGSAVCRVPPLMMCNPNPDAEFDPAAHRGMGLRLLEKGPNASWAPGVFGYLNVGAANNGTPDLRQALGMDSAALSCVDANEGSVDPGGPTTVTDALNVRFDIYTNAIAQGNQMGSCFATNTCSPAENVVKDVVRREPASSGCDVTNNNNQWRLPANPQDAYVPTNDAGDDADIRVMGLPRDVCHYRGNGIGSCTEGRLGDGNWRRDLYFATNHGPGITATNWMTETGLPADVTRYEVYRWEIEQDKLVSAVRPLRQANNNNNISGASFTNFGAPQCRAPASPGPNQPDRRVLSVAVVNNCDDLNGGDDNAQIGKWVDMFLVEPSLARTYPNAYPTAARTAAGEIYVEVIGETLASGDGVNAQVVRRDRPYLVR